jgi:hypothetical protein
MLLIEGKVKSADLRLSLIIIGKMTPITRLLSDSKVTAKMKGMRQA